MNKISRMRYLYLMRLGGSVIFGVMSYGNAEIKNRNGWEVTSNK